MVFILKVTKNLS